MSASSSSSLPVPTDYLLPLIKCPLCGADIVTNVARTGEYAGQRFYKCSRYDARECRFFEFQESYVRRMTPLQIARAQQLAGGYPGAQVLGVPQANPANQAINGVRTAIRRNVQPIQANQQPEPEMVNQLLRPVAAVAAASGSQALGVVAVLLAATNIMLTTLVLMFVVAMYFGSGN